MTTRWSITRQPTLRRRPTATLPAGKRADQDDFLKGKKKKFYMVIMDDKKRMDFHEFQDLTGAKRVSMARPEDLQEQLGLAPGIVSPFGLLNNTAYNVQVYFDQDIVDEPIQTFHPNENTHTIFIKTPDLFKFLKAESYNPEIIDL